MSEMQKDLKDSLNKYPALTKSLIESCKEMLKDSGPDKEADYFEEKDKVKQAMGSLT
jgi:hypothetical protein